MKKLFSVSYLAPYGYVKILSQILLTQVRKPVPA